MEIGKLVVAALLSLCIMENVFFLLQLLKHIRLLLLSKQRKNVKNLFLITFGEVGIGGDVNSDRSFVSRNGTESLRTPGLPPTLICSRRNFSSMEISMFLSSTGLGQSITNNTHLT